MIEASRRSFLRGFGAALVGLAAPAVIRTAGVLMPIRVERKEWQVIYQPYTDSLIAMKTIPAGVRNGISHGEATVQVIVPEESYRQVVSAARRAGTFPWIWKIDERALTKAMGWLIPPSGMAA